MASILDARLYMLIFVLLIILASVGCSLFRKCITRAKAATKLADVEAGVTHHIPEKQPKQAPRLFSLPANLDPVVYPSAARKSSSKRLPSYQRIVPNPFRARSADERLTVIIDTTVTADGGDRSTGNHGNDVPLSSAPIAIPPRRPVRPNLLDDLAGFPHDHNMARDMWFPLTKASTGRLELCVARGAHSTSLYPTKTGGGRVDFVLAHGKHEVDNRSVFSIDEDEVDDTPLTPSNTIVDILVSGKSRSSEKRDEKRRRRKNGRPRVHVFEIPELYVNARPYEDIEAEEEARAVAAKEESEEEEEEEEEEEVTVAVEGEEQEALVAVAAAALAARDTRDTRDTREACKFLQVPERF